MLAGELNLCGLLAVGLLTFVFSTWRRGEETRNNHQAGFAQQRFVGTDARDIVKIGVNFSSVTRNITGWIIEL